MEKLTIRNSAFHRIGDQYGPVIDPNHFMGHSAFSHPWKEGNPGEVTLGKTDELFVMDISVKGFSKDELSVAISDGILVVRGLKERKEQFSETAPVLEEIDTDSFERKFRINANISREKITAEHHADTLRLTFIDVPPGEEANARFIQVI